MCRAGHHPAQWHCLQSPLGIQPLRGISLLATRPAASRRAAMRHANRCMLLPPAGSMPCPCQHTAPACCSRPALLLPACILSPECHIVHQPAPLSCVPSHSASCFPQQRPLQVICTLAGSCRGARSSTRALRMDQEQQEETTREKSGLHTQLTAAFASTCSA